MADKKMLHNFVGGAYVEPADGGYADLIDPAPVRCSPRPRSPAPATWTGPWPRRPDAFPSWRDATPSERQRALLRIADAIEARADELVDAECRNTGKPRGLTASEELPPAVDQIRFFAGAARVLEGRSAGEYMAGHTRTCGASRSASAPR